MRVGLMCYVRYRIAHLIHIVPVPQLIDFAVDNFVYIMTHDSQQFMIVLFCDHY